MTTAKLLYKHAIFGAFGLVMGFSLSRIGFADFGEVHRMFTLVDPRLLLTFAGAVALAMGAFLVFPAGRRRGLARKPVHKGTVIGGILFGTGWAVTGACPSIGLVQLGEGHLVAAFTIVGIMVGTWSYSWVHRRYLRWDTGACET
jgi:uncharacterized membrane protein YedE/YeeE